MRRHGPGGDRSCSRCRWYTMEHRWATTYGRFSGPVVPQPRSWIGERPARWGGTWGLGCTLCSQSLTRRVDPRGTAGQDHRRLCTKWSRFEVRSTTLQAEHFAEHRTSDIHKVALYAWMFPDEPVQLKLQASVSDNRLLSGCVPQLEDWVRAWRAARTPQSWAAAAEKEQTEHFIRALRSRSTGSRPLEHMTLIMQDVLRDRKRAAIYEATSICLSFDDRGGFKLLRFRCDGGPSLHARVSIDGTPPKPSVSGVVGITQCLRGTSLNDFAEDYADRTVKEIEKMVVAFCTPLGGLLDERLLAKFYTSVRSVVADGALQKVAQYLQKSKMPNIVLITRDPAHMLRIAAKDPLLRSDRFGAQHERLFGKTGLLRQVQFSDALQARLEDCQRIVLRHSGKQGGDLRHIMRHFSFAAHRFESMNEPRRKYACVLHAVILLLADIAGDSRRKKEDRQRAEESLDAMTTQDLLETGLAGDFAELAMQTLRLFDRSDPDPALASTALADFADRVRRLFIDGYIMMQPDQPHLKTLTQIVLEQCSDIREFHYGERVKVSWTKTTKPECQETLREIGGIAADMLERIRADFGQNDLYMQFEAMDVNAWHLARQQGHDQAKVLALRRRARNLHEALRLQWNAEDWDVVITAAIRERSSPNMDNRFLWALLLSLPPDDPAQPLVMRRQMLIRFYVSLSDGTGDVERLLGRHAAFLAAHGPGALSEACLEITTEGPTAEHEIATQQDGRLLLTDFSRRCAHLWVASRGRRFGSYKLRVDKGTTSKTRFVGSLRAVQVKTRAAMNNLVIQARRDETPGQLDRRRTVVGHRRSELLLGIAALGPLPATAAIKKFRKTTTDRVKTKSAVAGLWRGFDKTLPAPRRKDGTRLPYMVGAPAARHVPVITAATTWRPTLALSQGRKRSAVRSVGRPIAAVKEPTGAAASPSDAIVVEDDLPHAPLQDRVLKTWLPAIAQGKTVSVNKTKTRIGFKAGVQVRATVRMTHDFSKKHKGLAAEMRRHTTSPGSKWHEVEHGGFAIHDLHSLRCFLVHVQRRPLVCGVGAETAKPAVMLGNVSRYGRPIAA